MRIIPNQGRPAPGLVPYWVWQRRRPKMLVTDLLRKVVVFVGRKEPQGAPADAQTFAADGTGFIFLMMAHNFAFPYVVTAKHVIDQAAGEDKKNDIFLRINTQAGGVDYVKTKFGAWITHPDHRETGRKQKYIDVAALSLVDYHGWARTDIFDKYDFTHLDEEDICTEEIIKKYVIGLGDEVVIPGLFHSHVGEVQNVPIVRIGNIAAMRGEPVPTDRGPMDAYLVEMRSVGGISGSPVLTHMAMRPKILLPESDRSTKIEQSTKDHYLLGLMHGHYTITTQDEWVFKTEQKVGDINAGIAVVVPAEKIMETILRSRQFIEGCEMARKYDEYRKSQAKTVEDSAPSAKSEAADDANPNHLKDFTRLVDVAVRKRPPDDQT